MAKLTGIIQMHGSSKASDTDFIKLKSGKIIARAKRKAGCHAEDAALKANYTSIKPVNELAGCVNAVMKYHAGLLCGTQLYQPLLTRLKRDRQPTRLLMLDKLEGMEANPKYRFESICPNPGMKIIVDKTTVVLEVDLLQHALRNDYLNSYKLDFTIIIFNDRNAAYTHEEQHTRWISVDEEMPMYFDLPYSKPAGSTDYLMICHCVRGKNKRDEGILPHSGMRVLQAGSFKKTAMAELERIRTERAEAKKLVPQKILQPDTGVASRGKRD